jgi:hypothetical protein
MTAVATHAYAVQHLNFYHIAIFVCLIGIAVVAVVLAFGGRK